MNNTQLVWFRQDLRLEDNPALYAASQKGHVIAVYLEATKQHQLHHESQAKMGLRLDAVKALRQALNKLSIPLIYQEVSVFDESPQALLNLANQFSCKSLYFNNEYPLNEVIRDNKVEKLFNENNLHTIRFDGDLVLKPSKVRNLKDKPYKVFSAYKKAWLQEFKAIPQGVYPKPKKQLWDLAECEQNDIVNPYNYRDDLWQSGEKNINAKLKQFLPNLFGYAEDRNIPSIQGTSCLSPYLAIGTISARQCIQGIFDAYQTDIEKIYQDTWLSELIWREFYRQILIDNYKRLSKHQPYKQKSESWLNNDIAIERFEAWKNAQTGFPIVDAAMLQLKQTGWMHNRLRMISAMFLNKLCLVDWRWGEKYFMQHLIDGDFASNNGGWQWCSSTGVDSVPYFRIMNPITQSKRFDPTGEFIKKILPQLESLDSKQIHFPDNHVRKTLGYPEPIIDYKSARETALSLLA